MSKNIFRKIKIIAIILVPLVFIAFSSSGDDNRRTLSKPGSNPGDSYILQVNRIILPLNSRGIIANVSVDGAPEGGFFDGKGFLFSGGFLMSGKNGAVIWSNGNASASRIEDYLPGTAQGWIDDENDPRFHMYVVNSQDEPFGLSWQEWGDAVDLGAYFYDGDGDGLYNPVDLNGNGTWDADEDMPDLLGDEVVWTVYTDALEASLRRYSDQDPVGVEVRQSVWGFAQAGDLGNIVFVRFSLNNAGTVADVLDSVYFGVWADPDLGDFGDDLVGSDLSLNSGYVYNDGADNDYGSDPPCFLIDFFQGPWETTGNPDDFAFNFKGPNLGIDSISGAVNLAMTSFIHYMQSHPTQGDPDNFTQARNYLTGRNQPGDIVDPCDWEFGRVIPESDCSLIDGRFMYSGDPPANKGWINIAPFDQRQMSNTGPITLRKNEPVDIVVAYVVGRGNSALESISVAKQIDRKAQFIFSTNFNLPPAPPPISPVIKTTDNSIELIWETKEVLDYFEEGAAFTFAVEGINVFMHQTNSLAEREGGALNTILLQSYNVTNDIQKVVLENPLTLESTDLIPPGIQLDREIYSDPVTGRISLTIETDPFTLSPLIKGKPYFISIVPVALNFKDLEFIVASPGFYRIPHTSAVGFLSPVQLILSDGVSPVGIVPGKDTYTPFPTGILANHTEGLSEAIVNYDVKDKAKVTDHNYEVSFVLDSLAELYDLYYSVTDLATGEVLLDSSKQYNGGLINDMVDGSVVHVEWVEPVITSTEYIGSGTSWFDNASVVDELGTWYMGKDVVDPLGFPSAINGANKSTVTTASDMKNIELRFGQTGKAHRWLRLFRYVYAGDSGFVDVPFQAWAVDKINGTEYQLTVGFTESALASDSSRNPDGNYDPGTDAFASKEYIVIFNSPYDPTGDQYAYTGNSSRWSDLGNGFNLHFNDPRFNDSLKTVAKSPYFDALYVVGLQRRVGQETAPMTGTFAINIASPLTPADKYLFKVDLSITADAERDLFNKINVFPNPLFAYNPAVGFTGGSPDAPYVTFSNLPTQVTIKIFSLSGNLIRTLVKDDSNPYMTWDLQNENRLRVASGMYLAIASNPQFGQKVLKFAIIMPQKQIRRF